MIYAKSAFSAAAMTLLMGSASFAQGAGPIAGERVDVQGMPTTHSTPAEQAETARINNQVGAEDDRLTNAVQRGLLAGIPEQGRLLTGSESLVVHFQKLVLLHASAGDHQKLDPSLVHPTGPVRA